MQVDNAAPEGTPQQAGEAETSGAQMPMQQSNPQSADVQPMGGQP